jgi:dihydrofolate synthase/folylpolyglutamate synthase
MGLARVSAVARSLGLAPTVPLITVGGTNGKGSTCAFLEAILRAAGYRVGLYTSPHLLRYNERVRIDGQEATDDDLCRAFAAIESARGDTSLTYFEFGTLAALWLFGETGAEVMILEVGLGGRLDAVNIFDADCAIVTSVDLDHQEYLGATREAIGYEKAGIFRAGRPAVCADPDPPHSLTEHAAATGTRLLRIGHEFHISGPVSAWRYEDERTVLDNLPPPGLAGDFQRHNAAAALAALGCLAERLPVSPAAIRQGLATPRLAGRFQKISAHPDCYVDVTHNPHAARALATNLRAMRPTGKTWGVCAMLQDKDIAGTLSPLLPEIDIWLVARIDAPRGASAACLQEVLARTGTPAQTFENADAALRFACCSAGENDRIIVFGSFYTVAAALQVRAMSGHGT